MAWFSSMHPIPVILIYEHKLKFKNSDDKLNGVKVEIIENLEDD